MIKNQANQKAIIPVGIPKQVEFAQKLGAGKYIKKPYTLEKIGIAVKEEFEKQAVFEPALNATIYITPALELPPQKQRVTSCSPNPLSL